MTPTPATKDLRNRRKSGGKATTEELVVLRKSNRNLFQHLTVPRNPRYVHAGHVKYILPDGTVRFIERAHPWQWAKAQHRHNEWLKKKNNDLLYKEVGSPDAK